MNPNAQATPSGEALVGRRVRATGFHVSHAGERDEHGLIRDEHGDVLTIDDNVTVPLGTEGLVDSVDAMGTLHVHWDNGSRLGLLPEVDSFEVLDPH